MYMSVAQYLQLLSITDVKLTCRTPVNASEPYLVPGCWETLHLLAVFILRDSPQCDKLLLVISRMLYNFIPIWGKSFPSYSKVCVTYQLDHLKAARRNQKECHCLVRVWLCP